MHWAKGAPTGPSVAIEHEMDSKPRRSVLTVARVGAVLVDIESGLTLGSYSREHGSERRETDNDPHLTDLPSVVPEPRTKSSRNK